MQGGALTRQSSAIGALMLRTASECSPTTASSARCALLFEAANAHTARSSANHDMSESSRVFLGSRELHVANGTTTMSLYTYTYTGAGEGQMSGRRRPRGADFVWLSATQARCLAAKAGEPTVA